MTTMLRPLHPRPADTATDAGAVAVETSPWTLDTARSTAHLSNKTLYGMLTVRGALTVDPADVAPAPAREGHLRPRDFLGAATGRPITVAVEAIAVHGGKVTLAARVLGERGSEPVLLRGRLTGHEGDAPTGDALAVVVTGIIEHGHAGVRHPLHVLRGLTRVTVEAVLIPGAP